MRKQKKVILHFAALSLAILLGSAKAEAQNYYAANTKKAVKAGSIAALVSTLTKVTYLFLLRWVMKHSR
jgi:uncharacterized protein HemY